MPFVISSFSFTRTIRLTIQNNSTRKRSKTCVYHKGQKFSKVQPVNDFVSETPMKHEQILNKDYPQATRACGQMRHSAHHRRFNTKSRVFSRPWEVSPSKGTKSRQSFGFGQFDFGALKNRILCTASSRRFSKKFNLTFRGWGHSALWQSKTRIQWADKKCWQTAANCRNIQDIFPFPEISHIEDWSVFPTTPTFDIL